jgi:predicted DNA-binding transcriptional regulator YafY
MITDPGIIEKARRKRSLTSLLRSTSRPLTSASVAKHLGVSERTALRYFHEMLADGTATTVGMPDARPMKIRIAAQHVANDTLTG